MFEKLLKKGKKVRRRGVWRGFGATPNILNSASPDFVISLGLIILAHQQILSHNFLHQKLKVWCGAALFLSLFLQIAHDKKSLYHQPTDGHKES